MKRFFWLMAALLTASAVSGEKFRYLYTAGEKYRILSTVQEEVFINGWFSHRADILNRITVEVRETDDRGGAFLRCTYRTSEEAQGPRKVFSWGQYYDSEFHRDSQGNFVIEPHYFMPIVRDVPVFPERDLRPGDSWVAPGEEVHDFRASFGLQEAVRIPLIVSYRYEGSKMKDGREYQVVSLRYQPLHYPKFKEEKGLMVPERISGSSQQLLYWDSSRGRPQSYEETFSFVFNFSGGFQVEYRGAAQAHVVDSDPMDRDLLVREIEGDIRSLQIPDTRVGRDDLGVTLTLENIQFPADSAELTPGEKEKLRRIGEILKKYPQRDILVTGHTALAGTEEGRQRLSEERAEAVGAFMLQEGVRSRDRMIYRGMGARVPVADNSTEAGMKKNRRVEITIMEN